MAQTQTSETKGKGRGVTARKNTEGQEEVIRLEALTKRIDHLITLKRKVETATADYSDAIKAVSEESGLQAKTVRSFVAARAGERFEERRRDVAQLALVFDEIGE